MTGGVAIHKGPQADLVNDSGTCKALGDDSDHDPEHRRTSVEAFRFLELLHVDVAGSDALEPGVIGLRGFHQAQAVVTKLNPKNQFFSSSRSPGRGSVQSLLAGSLAPVSATEPFI